MTLIDTPQKMVRRQAELNAPAIARLKAMSRSGRRSGDLILQHQFGIDTDYIPGYDDGEEPKTGNE